jgi:hypothetical protein
MVLKSRSVTWAEHVSRVGEKRNVHSVLVRKPARKRSFGGSGHIREDNIKVVLKKLDNRARIGLSWLRKGHMAVVKLWTHRYP